MPTFIKSGLWEKRALPGQGYKGELNLDNFISGKANQEIHNIPYPFINYPESTLFNAGPLYEYPSGMGMGLIPAVTLNSYRVKGIVSYSGSSVISIYLGTIKIIPNSQGGVPVSLIFPGKLTGTVMATPTGNFWDPTVDITCTPLADGAMMWDVDAGDFNKLNDVRVMMYSYGPANPTTGEVNYALVLEGYGVVPTSDYAEALISYDFEFVSSSDAKVTLWWD